MVYVCGDDLVNISSFFWCCHDPSRNLSLGRGAGPGQLCVGVW